MNFNELSEEQLAKLVPGTPEYEACDRFFKMRILGLLNQRIKFMKDQETKEKFIELRASGKSYAAIAEMLGIGRQTALRWAKELKERVDTMRAMRLDELYEKHALATQTRIELLGDQLKRMREEIRERNFGDVPTSGLLSLFCRVSHNFQREWDSLKFHEISDAPNVNSASAPTSPAS